MSFLVPFSPKIENKIAKGYLEERFFQEAREFLQRKRRVAGDVALNLILAASSLQGKNSLEARTALEVFRLAVGRRAKEYVKTKVQDSPYPGEEFSTALEPELKITPLGESSEPAFKAEWTQVLPSVRSRRRKLTEFRIEDGYAIFEEEVALEVFLDTLMEEAREKIDHYSGLELEEERLEELAGELERASRKRAEKIASLRGKQAPLKEELFPPCIKICLQGISSGARNYSITVLLTAFLSYARIAPFSGEKDSHIADFVKDMRVVKEEIMPVIEEAARRCDPPLFEDQPLEKMNVYYHLGLGLTSEPELENSGQSPWYFVPNCDKIRREAPSLCQPDGSCKNIKNPLTYYVKKRFSRE